MSTPIYHVTFANGSDTYLAHAGVKGMKWHKHLKALDPEYLASLGLGGPQGGGISEQIQGVEYNAGVAIQDTIEGLKETAGNLADEANKQKEKLRARFLGPRPYDPVKGPVDSKENIAFAKEHPDVFMFKNKATSADEDMAKVNPNYKYAKDDLDHGANWDLTPKALINCVGCSMTYDLRRRGYGVDAAMATSAAYITLRKAGDVKDEVKNFYKDAKFTNVPKSSIKEADKELSKMPEGARGMLVGITNNGGGHAIAWEKENGQVVYRDCQDNTKYSAQELHKVYSEQFSNYTRKANGKSGGLQYARLDNCEPNLRALHDEGIVSKQRAEFTYGQAKKDAARAAYGETMREYRFLERQGKRFTTEEKERAARQNADQIYRNYEEIEKMEKSGRMPRRHTWQPTRPDWLRI